MKLLYLACPYTHDDPKIREDRVHFASATAACLMMKGFAVYSPITHGHQVQPFLNTAASDHEFWMKQCLPVLRMCDEMVILPLDGWTRSRGLFDEMIAAQTVHIPVSVLQDFISFSPPIQVLPDDLFSDSMFHRSDLEI